MLYRKYRPLCFEQVKGQETTVISLKNALKLGKLHHAILFCGPRGLGKTTLARVLAKCVNCITHPMSATPCLVCESCKAITNGSFMDVLEIDAASNRGIDEIRELKEKINYRPSVGIKKIFIIDEVHMLTTEAFNALLKTLEEPPEHIMFILATTDPEKLPDTILSRCQRFDLASINYNDLKILLSEILLQEEVKIEDSVYKVIFERSGGSIRDSLSLLEKLILSSADGVLTLSSVEKNLGFVPEEKFQFFENVVFSTQIGKVLEFIDELWLEGIEVDDFFKQFCYYLKSKSLQNKESNFEWIEEILSVLYHFKNEEDKRLIGYVVVHKIRELEIPREKNSKKNLVSMREKISVKSEISLKEIESRWNELLSILKRKRIVMMAYLSGSKPISIEGNTLLIEFPEGHQFHVESMSKPKNREYLEEIFFEVFNIVLKIDIQIVRNLVVDEEEDLLKKVMDVFGGEIVSK
ncbi:MAG: DNA polymerase III subunit gamma/tau [Fusobacteria bacterium]|nr:DNA polymerase III subunit gamma/tau [Fusobacteriota bacterium]